MLENLFVSYELAKKLKEKGFNEPCIAEYYNSKLTFYGSREQDDDGELISMETYSNSEPNHFDKANCYSAPLFQQVVDWLRVSHRIRLEISFDWFEKEVYAFTINGKLNAIFHEDYYTLFAKAIEEALKLI